MDKNDINRHQFPIGSVVYFICCPSCLKENHPFHKKEIRWGIVEENYTSEVAVQLYDFCDLRTISSIPIKDFPISTSWRKLPKNWDRIDLYNIEYDNFPCDNYYEIIKTIKINNPDNVLQAIKLGIFEEAQRFKDVIDVEIDKNRGFRLTKKAKPYYRRTIASLPICKVYKTYEEAQKVLDDYISELNRQASLSDYDWNVEQLDEKLNFLLSSHYITEDDKNYYKETMLEKKNFEDIEFRLSIPNLQWKYIGNKKWKTLIKDY